MKIKFYLLHRDLSLYTCFVITTDLGINTYLINKKTNKVLPKNSDIHQINCYAFYLFLNELECCPTSHRAVARNIKRLPVPYVIQLTENKTEFIDKTWLVLSIKTHIKFT